MDGRKGDRRAESPSDLMLLAERWNDYWRHPDLTATLTGAFRPAEPARAAA
jgi:hypothetical protein